MPARCATASIRAMRTTLTVSAAVLSIALAACFRYGYGHDINFDDAKQLQPGVSTRADAIRIFGTPTATALRADGNTDLVWSYVHAIAYGPNGSKALGLTFDPFGKFMAVSSQVTTGADVGR